MKIRLIILIIIIASGNAIAQNPVEWRWIGESVAGDTFYQQFTHKRISDEILDVWDRTNFKRYKVSNKGKGIYKSGVYDISLTRYDCTERKYKKLQSTTYDSRGNVISSLENEYGSFKYSIPGSMSNVLLETACKMIEK